MTKIYVPKENVSDNTVKVTDIYFKNKEFVSEGDLLMSVETSKADMDIESEVDGFILYLSKKDEDCSINEIIAIIFDSIDELEKFEISNYKKSEYVPKNVQISKSAQKLINDNNINIQDLDSELITVELVKKHIERNQNLEDLNFNPKDIVLFGTGGGTEMVLDAIRKSDKYKVVGFIDDFSKDSFFKELPIFGGIDTIDGLVSKGLENLVLSYGFIGALKNRMNVFKKFEKKINFPNIIDPTSNIESSVVFGKGNIILANSYVGSNVKIGNINIVNTGALISHETQINDGNHFTPSSTIAGQVKIGSLCTFGMNSSVLMKTIIGDNVQINNNVATSSNIESNKTIKNTEF